MASLLSLFPLDVVLFPGAPLPLHIFEPRYKEMIGQCLADKTLFGVVRAVKDGVAEIGCTAEIVGVTKEYPDGRLDIVTEGRKRFEVMQLDRGRTYLRAEVVMLEDSPGAASREAVTQVIALHGEVMKIADALQDLSGIDLAKLSFHLASSLPLDLDFKQHLLGLSSESERIGALIAFLQAAVPAMRKAVNVKKTAGGNGHVH
jgi:Lon protease-like protein